MKAFNKLSVIIKLANSFALLSGPPISSFGSHQKIYNFYYIKIRISIPTKYVHTKRILAKY